jgi:ParB family transcriptional regulator, chromosome partitioning protein
MGKRKKAVRRTEESRMLAADAVLSEVPKEASAAAQQVGADGGTPLVAYREPYGGHGVVLAMLPIEKVAPTPYQRDLSKPHVDRLANVVDKLGRFLDPVIAVRGQDGVYYTPNGNHRLHALKKLKARAITALVVPEERVAFQILALNTERAHNLKEKSLEVIRMARALADGPRKENECAFEFEEPMYLTLGCAYEKKPRFAGSSYTPVVRRLDEFADEKIAKSLARREKIAAQLLELDEAVNAVVASLKEREFKSPYLKPFVVARINPIRFQKTPTGDLESVLDKMIASAKKFDPGKVKAADLQGMGGAPPAEE